MTKPKTQTLWAEVRVYKSQWGGNGELGATVSHPQQERHKESKVLQLAKIVIDESDLQIMSITLEKP